MRISKSNIVNHVTGVTTEASKLKPSLKNGQNRAFMTLDISDAVSGEKIESIEMVENVKKEVADQLSGLMVNLYSEFWGSGIAGVNTGRMYEIHLLDDEDDVESVKYVVDEGTIVGYARLDSDYGGADSMRGSRNQSLSGYSIDPDTGNIICEVSFIWDETRINGKRVNKVALSPVSSMTHKLSSSTRDYSGDDNMPVMLGSSHQWLWQSGDGRGWTLQIEEKLMARNYNTDYDNYCIHWVSHNHAFGHMLTSLGRIWEDKEFELEFCDLSIKPTDTRCYRSEDIRNVQLAGVTPLIRRNLKQWAKFHALPIDKQKISHSYITTQSKTLHIESFNHFYLRAPGNDRSLDRIFMVIVAEDKLTLKTYRPLYDEEGYLQLLPEVINTKEFTLDTEIASPREPIAVTMRDGDLEVFYAGVNHHVRWTLDLLTDTVTTDSFYRPMWISGISHVKDNIYIYANSRKGYRSLAGGYIDLDSDRAIETFRTYGGDPSYSYYNTVYPVGDQVGNNHSLFDCTNGRVINMRDGDENYSSRIAIPVDYIAPAPYLHVDTFVPREKKPTEQWRFTYRIEITPDTESVRLPFDAVHNFENESVIMHPPVHSSDRSRAKAARQDYRRLLKSNDHVRTIPTLRGKEIYNNDDYVYLYLRERENGDFYIVLKYRESKFTPWIEEEHDIIGWNRAIYDDTSDWRNQYLSIGGEYFRSGYNEKYKPFSRDDGLVFEFRLEPSYSTYEGVVRFHTPDSAHHVDWCNFLVKRTSTGFDAGIQLPGAPIDVSDLEGMYKRGSTGFYFRWTPDENGVGGVVKFSPDTVDGTEVEKVLDLTGLSWDSDKYRLAVFRRSGSGYNPAEYSNQTDLTNLGYGYLQGGVGSSNVYQLGLAHIADKDYRVKNLDQTYTTFAEFEVERRS